MATAVTNGHASHAPVEVSVPLPLAPRTDINIRLHDNGPNITLFLTTSTPDAASPAPLGSLVYAMPNVRIFLSNAAITQNKLTFSAENHTKPAAQHPSVHPQRDARLYDTAIKAPRTQNRQANLCQQLNELRERRHGRHSRRGNGRLQTRGASGHGPLEQGERDGKLRGRIRPLIQPERFGRPLRNQEDHLQRPKQERQSR